MAPFPCVFSWLSNPPEACYRCSKGKTIHSNLHPLHPTTMATCTATTRPEPCAGPCWGLATEAPPPTTTPTPCQPHGHPTSHWWLRHLAHGGEVRIVVAKSMPESVFAAGLLSQIRQRHLDLDALALHVATQEGTSTTKPAAMKLITSKIFDFLISLRPTATTDPASAATILQLQQQLAVAHGQLAQQAPSPSPPPTPTSSGKRPVDPSQASLLDFGMRRPRLTTSDTPLPDPLPARTADDSPSPPLPQQPPSPPHPRRHPGGFSPPLSAHLEGALRPAPTPPHVCQWLTSNFPPDISDTKVQRCTSQKISKESKQTLKCWSNDCAKWATTLDSDTRACSGACQCEPYPN